MYGRDILVRVMYGARVSMSVGVFAAILVLVIGALYGQFPVIAAVRLTQ